MPTPVSYDLDQEDPKVVEKIDAIGKRLDVIISLLLDLMPDDAFAEPRKISHKVHRLKLTRVNLRDSDIGRVVGSPSKDVSSRLREYESEDVIKRIKKRGGKPTATQEKARLHSNKKSQSGGS